MVHHLLENNIPITLLLYFETDWDFPSMNYHLEQVIKKTGLKIVRVRYYRHFSELLSVYGWPHPSGGWCTRCKHDACVKYVRQITGPKTEYIDFSADEKHRSKSAWMTSRKWPVSFPLIDANVTGADALAHCRALGYDWDGLYDIFPRLGCAFCPKGGPMQRDHMRRALPRLYSRWEILDVIAANAHNPNTDALQT